MRVGLVGSPNSGKTTLFNALTGLRAKVANYPGVTVERREGVTEFRGRPAVIVDLPGTYSLNALSPDERVVNRVLDGELDRAPDALVIAADVCSLERSMLLIGQILRRDLPTCLVLTMTDEFHARGGELDIPRLEQALGIPVRGVVGHRGRGLPAVRELLADPESWPRPPVMPPADTISRAGWAESVLASALSKSPGLSPVTEAIDRVLLHPLAGTLLFAAVMVTFFQLIFAWAQPAMDVIDAGVGWAASGVKSTLPPGLLASFLADGLIAGVGAVIIFVPQITILFTALFILEDVGYLARAAFVVDRAMGRIGLEGRAFVALLSSYACAVPGIMATRTIPSPHNRLITILVAPLMTCSARLPVYALLIAAFVPGDSAWGPLGMQGLVLLSLYLAGAVAAVGVAAILKQTLLGGGELPFYMELPPYRLPTLKSLFYQVWGSVRAFLRRAGTIILCASIVLWVMLTFPITQAPDGASPQEAARFGLEHSYAGRLGRAIEPAIAPLGFDWKIGVGLIASLAAREVIVSTLAQIYSSSEDEVSLRRAIREDIDPRTGKPVFTAASVASLLVFFVFALQCTSTLAAMRRETSSWRWPAFAFSYLLALAYAASFATHRVVTLLS